VSAIRKLFEKVGYTEESHNTELERDQEKVVFFLEDDGSPLHFAKQLPDGRWSSKLGRSNDITHNTLEDIAGQDAYGTRGLILKRRKMESKQAS